MISIWQLSSKKSMKRSLLIWALTICNRPTKSTMRPLQSSRLKKERFQWPQWGRSTRKREANSRWIAAIAWQAKVRTAHSQTSASRAQLRSVQAFPWTNKEPCRERKIGLRRLMSKIWQLAISRTTCNSRRHRLHKDMKLLCVESVALLMAETSFTLTAKVKCTVKWAVERAWERGVLILSTL